MHPRCSMTGCSGSVDSRYSGVAPVRAVIIARNHAISFAARRANANSDTEEKARCLEDMEGCSCPRRRQTPHVAEPRARNGRRARSSSPLERRVNSGTSAMAEGEQNIQQRAMRTRMVEEEKNQRRRRQWLDRLALGEYVAGNAGLPGAHVR